MEVVSGILAGLSQECAEEPGEAGVGRRDWRGRLGESQKAREQLLELGISAPLESPTSCVLIRIFMGKG